MAEPGWVRQPLQVFSTVGQRSVKYCWSHFSFVLLYTTQSAGHCCWVKRVCLVCLFSPRLKKPHQNTKKTKKKQPKTSRHSLAELISEADQLGYTWSWLSVSSKWLFALLSRMWMVPAGFCTYSLILFSLASAGRLNHSLCRVLRTWVCQPILCIFSLSFRTVYKCSEP